MSSEDVAGAAAQKQELEVVDEEAAMNVEIVPDKFIASTKVDILRVDVVPEVIANTYSDVVEQIILLDELIPIAPISGSVRVDAEKTSMPYNPIVVCGHCVSGVLQEEPIDVFTNSVAEEEDCILHFLHVELGIASSDLEDLLVEIANTNLDVVLVQMPEVFTNWNLDVVPVEICVIADTDLDTSACGNWTGGEYCKYEF